MADSSLPMAQIPNFQLGGTNIPMPNNAGVNTQGFLGGMQAQQLQQQISVQQQQLAIQQQQAQIAYHKEQVDSALNYVGKIGEQLQYLSPDSVKTAIANGMNTVAKVAPEFGIQPVTPDQVPDEAQDLMVQYGKLRQAHQDGKVSDPTFQTEGQNLITQMSKYQREMLMQSNNIIGTPNYQPGQDPSGNPTVLNPTTGVTSPAPGGGSPFVPTTTAQREKTQLQEGAAGAAVPYVKILGAYHTADAALSRGDQLGDRTALFEGGKVLNDGQEMPVDEMKRLAKSGFFGKNIADGITTILGSGDMTPTQRSDFKTILDLHMQGNQKASQVQTALYPGATGPNLSTSQQPITKTLKSGKTVTSSDGGKTWFYK